jgi:hypothetical protein
MPEEIEYALGTDYSIDLDRIKSLLKNVESSNLKLSTPLGSKQQLIIQEVDDCAYGLYCELIVSQIDFSLPNFSNSIIESDDDGLNEFDKLKFFKYFMSNREVIYDLIAYKFFSKKKRTKNKTRDHLFYISLFSKYTGKYEDVFIYKNNVQFDVLDETNALPKKYNISSLLYDFFGYSCDIVTSIVNQLKVLFDNKASSHESIQDSIKVIFNEFKDKISDDFDLNEGVITFCDFLGWKGLWKNSRGNHLKKANELIQRIEFKMKEYTIEKIPYSKFFMLSRLISISDTIAIFTPKTSMISDLELIELHAKICSYILEESVTSLFAIRGAITYGLYNYRGNIMIGPGIDESASWHEKGDWIGVILSPSAEFKINDQLQLQNIVKYENIPFKEKLPKLKYCVNWNVKLCVLDKLIQETKAMTPDIASKYINTRNFISGS